MMTTPVRTQPRTKLVTQAFDLQMRLDRIARDASDACRQDPHLAAILYSGRTADAADRAYRRTRRRMLAALSESDR
jgi:hypothetical protein